VARPRIYREQRVHLKLRVPSNLHARLHAAAAERDVSANLLATHAIIEFLDRLESVEDSLRPARVRSMADRHR